MTGNQEVPGRKRRSGDEIKRLVLEFEASGLRQNELSESRFGVDARPDYDDDYGRTVYTYYGVT